MPCNLPSNQLMSTSAAWIAERGAVLSLTGGWTQGLLGQHRGASQQHVITRLALHDAPKIGALKCVNVLSGADVY